MSLFIELFYMHKHTTFSYYEALKIMQGMFLKPSIQGYERILQTCSLFLLTILISEMSMIKT